MLWFLHIALDITGLIASSAQLEEDIYDYKVSVAPADGAMPSAGTSINNFRSHEGPTLQVLNGDWLMNMLSLKKRIMMSCPGLANWLLPINSC